MTKLVLSALRIFKAGLFYRDSGKQLPGGRDLGKYMQLKDIQQACSFIMLQFLQRKSDTKGMEMSLVPALATKKRII